MLICIQRIIFITHFFFNILQRNTKLVILGNLGMPGHMQFQETFDVHLQAKNQLHLSCSPWDVAKTLQYVILSTLGMFGYAHPKWSMNWQKTFVFICRHKINFILLVFLEIFQRHTNFLFWVLWTCLTRHTQKDSMKLTSSFTSFLRCYILKNSAISLA